jgi:hypothetical protein
MWNTGSLKQHCHSSLQIWNHEEIAKTSTICDSYTQTNKQTPWPLVRERTIPIPIAIPTTWKIRVEPTRQEKMIAQCTKGQSYGHTKEWLHSVHGAKAMAIQKCDCTVYTGPKLWPYKRVTAQCTRGQSYGHTKEWLHIVHGAKAMAIQKSDCTTYKGPKLWRSIGHGQLSSRAL